MDIVQLRNIKKQYGEKVIFQDINLNIPAGFFYGVAWREWRRQIDSA